ncbi:hypothetical protein H5410_061381, partial [Solanum commersonii]
GGKDGKPPNMDTIFFETHKKDTKLVEPVTNAKYGCLLINFFDSILIHLLQILRSLTSDLDFNLKIMWLDLW